MSSAYMLQLQRPLLKELRTLKRNWTFVHIVGCASMAAFFSAIVLDANLLLICGETLLAAGALPFLLTLPFLCAKLSHRSIENRRVLAMPSSLNNKLAYVSYVVFVVVGILIIRYDGENDDWKDVLAESVNILAEVGLLGFIATVCRVPVLDEDETKAFLTDAEISQVERSGTLHAPFVLSVNYALDGEYADDLKYLYPAEFVDANGDSVFAHSRVLEAALNRSRVPHFVNSDDVASKMESSRKSFSSIFHGAGGKRNGEHLGDGCIGGSKMSEKGKRLVVTRVINANPTGWDSPWYVTALGRCDVRALGDELIVGLLTCVTGSNDVGDRFVCESAILSLGHLFYASKDRRVSQRIFDAWSTNEISSIRNACASSLRAIKNQTICGALDIFENPETLRDLAALREYFFGNIRIGGVAATKDTPGGESDADAKKMNDDTTTATESLAARRQRVAVERAVEVLSDTSSDCATRVLAVARVCCLITPPPSPSSSSSSSMSITSTSTSTSASSSSSYEDVERDMRALNRDTRCLLKTIDRHVLDCSFELHYLKTLALETVRRFVIHGQRMGNLWAAVSGHVATSSMASSSSVELVRRQIVREVNALANATYSRSVFKSVRTAALRLLETTSYPLLDVYGLFSKQAVRHYRTTGFSAESVTSFLEVTLARQCPKLLSDLKSEIVSMRSGGVDAAKKKLLHLFKGSSENDDERVFDANTPERDPVLLLYAFCGNWGGASTSWVLDDHFVLQRLNSPDWLERFTGMLCVGRFANELIELHREVVPRFSKSELISNVRDVVCEVIRLDVRVDHSPVCFRWFRRRCREGERGADNSLLGNPTRADAKPPAVPLQSVEARAANLIRREFNRLNKKRVEGSGKRTVLRRGIFEIEVSGSGAS
eukprot:g2029.t1